MQFAELAAEGEMLGRGDVLVAEEDHEIFGERTMDFVHLAIGPRVIGDELADIDAGDFRADDRGEFLDADGLVGLGVAGDVPVTGALLAGQRAHGRSPMVVIAAIVARMERSAIRDQSISLQSPGFRFAPPGLRPYSAAVVSGVLAPLP